MSSLRCQRTIAQQVAVTGFGYWSGQDVRVEFRPAKAGCGVIFVRGDLPRPVRLPVDVRCRVAVPRRTCLQVGDVRVEMVEHVLAALSGLGIDNCEVWVDAAELPGCDGSSQAFVEALDRAGIVDQSLPVCPLRVDRKLRLGDEQAWIEISPPRVAGLSIEYRLDYGPGPIGSQSLTLEITPETFRQGLASCRTFLLEEEASLLMSQGLGGRVTPSDLLIFNSAGPIANSLRFTDECVRHKILDIVGDLALANCPIVGHVIANQSGHALNSALVTSVVEQSEDLLAARRCA
jgi:UDP-3-O-acyl N-acetylglucosamine deacetylase